MKKPYRNHPDDGQGLPADPYRRTPLDRAWQLYQRLVRETPEPFARRNILCGNRPHQNKYEMSAWVQEASAKGITDPGEVWRYARQ
jgi:hypothetical protein